MNDMLDLTVLRSGLMDGFCVVLFEVGAIFLLGEPGSPPTLGDDHEGFGLSCEDLEDILRFRRLDRLWTVNGVREAYHLRSRDVSLVSMLLLCP